MLKHLQASVEEEEVVWKSKMAGSEEQLRAVRHVCSSVWQVVFSSHPLPENDTKTSP